MRNLTMNAAVMVRALMTLLLLTILVTPTWAGHDATFSQGRIALSYDGNNDPDDVGALPAALTMIAKAGFADRVVHVHYNSQVWKDNWKNDQMHTSATEGAARFEGMEVSNFFDAEAIYSESDRDDNALNDHLAAAIDASSEDDPLWLLVAGPYEVVWRAARQSDPAKRQYVRIISHSNINDTNDGEGSGHTRSDVEDLGFEVIDIPDQNGGFSTHKDFGPWQWMKNHDDPDVRWVYERMEIAGRGGKADISDAGMAFYLMTGEKEGGIDDLRDYWSHPLPDPEPATGSALGLGAVLLATRWRRV